VTTGRRTLADTAHELLRSAILDGTIDDGAVVNQVLLAREYGMSRVPIREAVQRLMAEGLLVGASQRRVTVAVVGPRQVAELVDIREELEILALRRLNRGMHQDQLDLAAEANTAMARAPDPATVVKLDLQFHSHLMAGMPTAAAIVLDIRKRTQKYIDRLHLVGSPRPNGAAEHADVLAAVRAGDTEAAAQRLRRHIDRTRQLLAQDESGWGEADAARQ
jgi:DNA-binding GntR family transcriptional regulator